MKEEESREIALADMSTEELIALHVILEDRDDTDAGPLNQLLADIETLLIDRGFRPPRPGRLSGGRLFRQTPDFLGKRDYLGKAGHGAWRLRVARLVPLTAVRPHPRTAADALH